VSTNSVPPLNLAASEVSLTDLLNLFKKEIMLDLNCHHVGTIQSFNSSAQTAVVTINYTKTFYKLNSTTGLYAPVQYNYPPIQDVPVVCMKGGSASLTFPIAAGDECILLCNDRSIDTWHAQGNVAPPPISRYHSLSDAFALVGVSSVPNLITAYDAVRAVIMNNAGTLKVGINPETNLLSFINNGVTLGTLLNTLATSVCIPGAPIAPTVATQLITFME
jgi:hypothetical protein